jgi:hypothetical protein
MWDFRHNGAAWHLQHDCSGRGLGRCTGRGCWQPSLAAPGAVPDYFLITVDGRRMLKNVKRISFCSSHYWPTVAVASSRGGALEHRASLSFYTEYAAATRGPSTLTHFGLASPRSFIAEKSQVLFYLVFCIYLEAGRMGDDIHFDDALHRLVGKRSLYVHGSGARTSHEGAVPPKL